MPRSVLMLVNRAKPDAAGAVVPVRRLIERAGGRVTEELDATDTPAPILAQTPDLILVLGGDGTLLSQSRRFLHLQRPMLGVNLGRLGFMAEFDLAALDQQAASLFGDDPLHLSDRPVLAARLIRAGETSPDARIGTALALNEAVIAAGAPFSIVTLALRIDGQPGPAIAGDGVVVCTPTGSTAYNVSAGGPIIAPDVRVLGITPLAAHTLAFRPVVVGGDCTIELTMQRVNAGTSLLLDGRIVTTLGAGDRVVLSMHERAVRFVTNPLGSYWATLSDKLHWGAPPKFRPAGDEPV